MFSIPIRNQKKVIGFDLDGVIIDHTQNKIRVAKELGVLLDILETPSDILNGKLERKVTEQIDKMIYDEPRIALTPPLFPGAKAAISQISKLWPYFLISRRTANDSAIKLLKTRGLWPKYFNDGNAFFVATKEDKDKKAIELGINIYMDDQPSVLEKMINVPHRVLLDPLGVYQNSGYYKKISSWREFLTNLDGIN